MNIEGFAGREAIYTANYTGTPQTVYADGFDSWYFGDAAKVYGNRHATVSWLPVNFFDRPQRWVGND